MKHIESFWKSKLPDLATLKQRVPDSILVALDAEGVTQRFDGRQINSDEISEIGVAVFRANEKGLHFIPHLEQFYDQNGIEAFTIRVHERQYGPVVGTMTDALDSNAGSHLHKYISRFEGSRILLMYHPRLEIKWIKEKCPSLTMLFSGWCDVQELVAKRYMDLFLESRRSVWRYPSLQNTLKAMRISGWRSAHQVHGGAADSVKALAILSGLFCDVPLREVQRFNVDSVSVFCYLPPPKSTRIHNRWHLFTARITTVDGGKLPRMTPAELRKRLQQYPGLKGVGLNARNEILARDRVRIWWVSFQTQHALDSFIAEFGGSTFEGKKLRVVADGKTNEQLAQAQLATIIEATKSEPDLLLPFDDLHGSVVHPFDALFGGHEPA